MIAGTYDVEDYDMLILFQIAYKEWRQNGLARHERGALKRVFERLKERDRAEITRHLGTDFIDSFMEGAYQ